MTRRFLVLAVCSSCSLGGALACGSAPSAPSAATSSPSPAPIGSLPSPVAPPVGADDAGSQSDGGTDATSASTTAPLPSGNPPSAADAAPPAATGTMLAAGAAIDLFGVTDDGFAIYNAYGEIHATALVGGADVVVANALPRSDVTVSGSVAFVRRLGMAGRSTLSAWTSAHGSVLLDANALPTRPVAASADGTKAAFLAGEASPALTLAATDGTSTLSLGSACVTALAFQANGDLASANCPATVGDAADGAALPSFPSLSIYAPPGYTPTRVATDGTYLFDGSGNWLWAVGDDGTGRLTRVSDGTIAFTDPSPVGAAFFDPAGTALYYVSGRALRTVSLANPAAAGTVLASEVGALLAISPDGSNVAYANGSGAYALSTRGENTTVPVAAPRPNTSVEYTADSTAVVVVVAGNGASSYEVRGVEELETFFRGEANSVSVLAGSKVLVVDPANDGHIRDVANLSDDEVVPQMGAFAVSKDGSKVAYVAEGVAAPGLYVVDAQAAQGSSSP